MRILGVIPARGGSKGIPGKNIKPLGGLPLIGHTIKTALAAGCLDRVWVSTDDPAIARACEGFGVRVPWLRPAKLARDDSPIEDALIHLLGKLAADEGYRPDAVMLLQPTSPFRKAATIRKAVELFKKTGRENVLSVAPARSHPYWCQRLKDGDILEPFCDAKVPARRQDLPAAYCYDGSIYLAAADRFLKERSFTGKRDHALVVPDEEALDLDTPSDWALAEALWSLRGRPAGAPCSIAGPDGMPFIIAEAGVNHNGDIGLAEKLVLAAKQAGADAVKFQTFRTDKLVSRFAAKAPYQLMSAPKAQTQREMLKGLELDKKAHLRLKNLCDQHGIMFLSSPFDEASADLLEKLGVPLFKIGSGEITNKPLLEHIAAKNKPVILSTGMSTLEEVAAATGWIKGISRAELILLHCVTEYPAPPDQANLKAMDTLRGRFGLPTGYSDHTTGIEIAVAAAARGACVIEKHLTLDKKLPGPDHAASLEPQEFAAMTAAVRTAARAVGDGIKRPAPCELANRDAARRSLVAGRALRKGHALAANDVAVKRPGNGIPPSMAEAVVGRTLLKDVSEDETLTWEALS